MHTIFPFCTKFQSFTKYFTVLYHIVDDIMPLICTYTYSWLSCWLKELEVSLNCASAQMYTAPLPAEFATSFGVQLNEDDVLGTDSAFEPPPIAWRILKGKLLSIFEAKADLISSMISSSDMFEFRRIFPTRPCLANDALVLPLGIGMSLLLRTKSFGEQMTSLSYTWTGVALADLVDFVFFLRKEVGSSDGLPLFLLTPSASSLVLVWLLELATFRLRASLTALVMISLIFSILFCAMCSGRVLRPCDQIIWWSHAITWLSHFVCSIIDQC